MSSLVVAAVCGVRVCFTLPSNFGAEIMGAGVGGGSASGVSECATEIEWKPCAQIQLMSPCPIACYIET